MIIEDSAIRDRQAQVPHKAGTEPRQAADTAAAPIAIHDARPGHRLSPP